jgi:nitroimidazol reductase NimA-like FMN-containing flavoprotein (pyridoxamine 5'-phosphate oxidase superfamily)
MTTAIDRTPDTPRFRALARRECEALLRASTVGRIAFCFHERVDIEPIHYVYDDGWIVFRTASGTKFSMLRHNRWVAFEVDEVRGLFDWRSVVVHGPAYPLDESTEFVLPKARERALALLARVVPGTGTDDDPVPARMHVFHLKVEELTGRAARSSAAPRRRARTRR